MEIVQGIILKTSPYSETQKIIRIYTKEKGYLSTQKSFTAWVTTRNS